MKTVKIYNIKKMVEKETDNTRTSFEKELAIIEAPKAVLIVDNEAVHNVYDSIDKKHMLQIHALNNGNISIIPCAVANVTIKELIKEAECREAELTEFVRSFGSRIECNYDILLKSLKKAGLNPEDYPRDRDKSRKAEQHA